MIGHYTTGLHLQLGLPIYIVLSFHSDRHPTHRTTPNTAQHINMNPRCPDCGVRLERTAPMTALDREKIKLRTDEPREGILGSLGAKETVDVFGYVCPECGLVRWYAELDD